MNALLRCTRCERDNPAGNAFCGGCGAPLALVCAACTHPNPSDHAFCGRCGARLDATPEPAGSGAVVETGERRQLTVLFCDLVGSTELSARLDPEEYREALRAYHEHADEIIGRYDGYVAQHLGDGLLVYFGWPRTSDDAAERAVRAALGLVEATVQVQAGGTPLAARAGIHTGSVVVSDVGVGPRTETLALGDTPNIAARVQGAAQPSEVVVTAATHRLVSGLFVVEPRGTPPLKGLAQAFELFRVVGSSGVRGFAAAASHGLTPFVNRTEERALLRSRFERARDGEGQVVVLTGEAGIGKSRLVQVLRDEIADTPHSWLETGGSPHFTHTPFWAVGELLGSRRPGADDDPAGRAAALARALARAGLDPAQALPLVAPLVDVPLPAGHQPVTAAPDVVRKRLLATLAAWLYGMARLQPLVLLIEDLHWLDPSSLELLQLLVEQGSREPLLLLGTTRPEFQPPWPLRAHHTQLTLSRLPRRHARDMVLGVAAKSSLLAEVIDAVAARTDGVPLFVEELTKAVLEAGTSATQEIPATLADSLMARLDRLGTDAKEAAQVGAVCGREFSFGLLRAVHGTDDGPLEAALGKLVDAELLHARGLPPDATYTFRHALVQDMAYESLLKSRRRRLHAQVADELARQSAAVADDRPALRAHHRTAAHQHAEAIALWVCAGERALEHGAHREAEYYLERGLALLEHVADETQREWFEFQLQLDLGVVRMLTHGYTVPAVGHALERAMGLAERLGDPTQIMLVSLGLFITTHARNGPRAAGPLADRLLELASRSGSGPLAGAAHLAAGMRDYHLGRPTAARAHFTTGIARYDAPGPTFPIDFGRLLRTFLAEAHWQLGFADQARATSAEALRRASSAARVSDHAEALAHAMLLGALMRDAGEVHRHAETLETCVQELNPALAALAQGARGWALAAGGEIAAGRTLLVEGIAQIVATGQRLGLGLAHCLLADVELLAGELDAALAALADAENACPEQRADRPEILARRAAVAARRGGASDEVAAAFDAALAEARRYEARTLELRIATGYARWLAAAARHDEARALLAPLYAGFSEGFDTPDLRAARAELDALGEAPPQPEKKRSRPAAERATTRARRGRTATRSTR